MKHFKNIRAYKESKCRSLPHLPVEQPVGVTGARSKANLRQITDNLELSQINV